MDAYFGKFVLFYKNDGLCLVDAKNASVTQTIAQRFVNKIEKLFGLSQAYGKCNLKLLLAATGGQL